MAVHVFRKLQFLLEGLKPSSFFKKILDKPGETCYNVITKRKEKGKQNND